MLPALGKKAITLVRGLIWDSNLERPIGVPLRKFLMSNINKINTNDVMKDEGPDPTSTKVYVQTADNSDTMTIAFKLTIDGRSKIFNLTRRPEELLGTALERIKNNAAKINKGSKKTKKLNETEIEASDIEARLFVDGKLIDPTNTRNIDAWTEGAILKLNGKELTVKKNEPQVTNMKLPQPMMRNFVTIPFIEIKNCDIDTCLIEWSRQLSGKEKEKLLAEDPSLANKMSLNGTGYWLKVGDQFAYCPSEDDVAHTIKCVCQPRDLNLRFGLEYSIVAGPVEVGPAECPFEKRHKHTSKYFEMSDDKFRFVTYNILADLYADSDFSRSVLFSHCPAHALALEYRRQLLLKELSGYKADIICLQEVDKKEFVRTYEPYFRLIENHSGLFHTKGGQVAEGVATFYRNDRFQLIDSHRTILNRLIDPKAKVTKVDGFELENNLPDAIKRKGDEVSGDEELNLLQDYPHPILDDLGSDIAKSLLSKFELLKASMSKNPATYERFINRHTVIQTSLLQRKDQTSSFLVVANTHLYFAPDADHIRLLQGCACATYMEFIKNYYRDLIRSKHICEDDPDLRLIFCGDLNSSPDCGIYTLLQEGHVGKDLKDWQSNLDEKVSDLSYSTNLRFSSAYKNIPYTNYTPGFNGCLDYIYYDRDGFDLDRTIPLPDHKDVIASGGIPSDVFPSDHIALIADLKFK